MLLVLSRMLILDCRDVSFQYPGSEEYALRNISFKVGPGQLCVCFLLGVYVQTLLIFVIFIGHYRFERIRKEHDSKACSSYI
jgi:ABC-type multidrug transport system fused ATPase/permease subunit